MEGVKRPSGAEKAERKEDFPLCLRDGSKAGNFLLGFEVEFLITMAL